VRNPRGRNLVTISTIRRAVTAARATGVDRIEIELPDQSRVIFTGIVNKPEQREPSQDEFEAWKKTHVREA